MGVLADIFSHRIDHGNGAHSDVLIGRGNEPDQYAMWNPLQHPRDPSGHFANKPRMDDSGAALAMDAPGPGIEGGEMPPMQAPPLPPARAAVARVELNEKIDHRIKEVARHIPDYFLDGNGRTTTAHITIKMFVEDEPEDITKVLQGEAPFRVVLGKVNVIEATESRPYDILKVDVHSPSIRRLHNKLSKALSGVRGGNGYQPFIKIADVQPGMGDKLIGWDGLEGESVIVKTLTFVRKDHTAHEIPLQGRQDEYQLDEYSQPMAYSMPEQYAKRKKFNATLPLFDSSTQQTPEARRPDAPLYEPPASTSTPIFDRPVQEQPRGISPPVQQQRVSQSRPGASEFGTISVPRAKDIAKMEPDAPEAKSLFSDEELQESRRISSQSQIAPAFRRQKDAADTSGIESGVVPGTSGDTSEPGGLESGGLDSGGDSGRAWVAPRVRTARPEFTTPADTSIVPASLQRNLMLEDDANIDPETQKPVKYDYQLQRTAKAYTAMSQHGGFLDASAPGTGKSRVQLATSKMWADNGMKAIIVTKKQAISADWDTFSYKGSFYNDGRIMDADAPGTLPKLLDGKQVIPEAGQSYITTYEKLPSLLQHIDNNTVLLFDESNAGKNEDRARSMVMNEAAKKAHSVMYSTATPADKLSHLWHMFRTGLFGNRPPEETYKELGLIEKRRTDKKTELTHSEWKIDPRIGGIEVYRRLNGLFNQMTKEGLMVKHEIDLSGTEVLMHTTSLPDKAYEELANLEDNLSDGLGIKNIQGPGKGTALLAMRRHQETYKVPFVLEHVQKELADDPNRQILIFVDRINESEVTGDSGETVHYSQGTVKILADELARLGIKNIGHLHGGSKIPHATTIRDFQAGRTKVMLATLGTGGTGIDLPDPKGDRPRTIIMMTPPLAADINFQALMRATRLSSKSNARLISMYANTPWDEWAKGLLSSKMSTLGAIVKGGVDLLQLPFDIGTEGVEDVIQNNRDEIARSQAHIPYQWRQLTGAPQIKREEELQKPLFEGMELSRRSKAASETSRRPPKGYKRRRYTQDGEPARYTMTAAEVSKAVKEWKEPSEAQVKAENYRKPRLHLHGLEIAIENPRGTSRKAGWRPLAHHYGYCARIVGTPAPDARDGDRIDIFVGPHPESEVVFVVDQERPSGRYDEPKVLMGFTNAKDARKGYLDSYPSGWHCGPITALTMNQFRAWLESGDTTRRIADQVSRYTAGHDFNSVHPRDKKTKRFIHKHRSLTLAQTLGKPPTSSERNAYREYVTFLKVGKNKPMPFKKWLDFHRAEKFRTQEQEIQHDSAEQEGSQASQVQDQAATRGENQTETQSTRPSRSTGEPSRNSLIHNFAAALYDSYYRDSE